MEAKKTSITCLVVISQSLGYTITLLSLKPNSGYGNKSFGTIGDPLKPLINKVQSLKSI